MSYQNAGIVSVGIPEEAYFYLEKDDWNDFGYCTTYHLHASEELTEDGKPWLIGHVNILKLGQEDNYKSLLQPGPLAELEEDFCSMATSLDYYERLSQINEKYRNRLLSALRDVLIYSDLMDDYKDDPGFRKSLMRSMSFKDDIFELAPLLISRNFHKLFDLGLDFKFTMPELNTPLEINFDSPEYGFSDKKLPNRIAVIIGRNGSGKSTLLSRISRIAFSSAKDRRDRYLLQVGVISPPGLGFPRIIFLSYSAFDSFNTPGIFKSDKETIVMEMKNGLGRYVFCGIRDIVAELEETLKDIEPDTDGKLPRRYILSDRTANNKLKSVAMMSVEFVRNLRYVQELELEEILSRSLELLAEETSMRRLFPDDLIDQTEKTLEKIFMNLSTGHKFVIHAVTSIIAYAAPRSLLLFDEPETHLHPPILAALMKTIRYILRKRNSFMIVASHSPVVLQETLERHVYVVRREGDLMGISQPGLETFGENVGILTQMAFGLTANVTDYHDTLDRMVSEYTESYFKADTTEEILDLIEQHFPNGLSMQARSYVISKIINRDRDVDA